jgi:hypothetical protein
MFAWAALLVRCRELNRHSADMAEATRMTRSRL